MPQGGVPFAQAAPQVLPLHVAVPPNGAGHGVHELPQLLTLVLDTHALPQRCVPSPQTKSQLVPLQVGVAPNGAVQAAHELPQLFTLSFGTQFPPH